MPHLEGRERDHPNGIPLSVGIFRYYIPQFSPMPDSRPFINRALTGPRVQVEPVLLPIHDDRNVYLVVLELDGDRVAEIML